MKTFALIFFIFMIVLCNSTSAAWYSPEWLHRTVITNEAPAFGAPLDNYPLLIQISNSAHHLFSNARNDGLDILFTTSDMVTKLDHEIEYYTNAGLLTAWVKIPSLTQSTTQLLYCYYGYSESSDQQNRTSVWDTNHKVVLHFSSNWNYYLSNTLDSTANGFHGQVWLGITNITNRTGLIGKAYHYNSNGSGTRYLISHSSELDNTNFISVEFMIYLPALPTRYQMNLSKMTGVGQANYSFYMYGLPSGSPRMLYQATSVPPGGWGVKSGTWWYTNHINTWIHTAWTYSYITGGQLYINGEPIGARVGSGTLSNALNISLFEGNDHYLDEFRQSGVERSAGWIKANYLFAASNNFFIKPGDVLSYHPEPSLSATPSSPAFAATVLFSNSTPFSYCNVTNVIFIFDNGCAVTNSGGSVTNTVITTFPSAGSKTNWIIVTDDAVSPVTCSNSIVLHVGEYKYPALDLYWIPENPYVGQYVVFIANSAPRYGLITNWQIDFGTGSKFIWRQYMSNHPVAYRYPYSGDHIVRFSVVDQYGFSNSIVRTNFVTDFGAKNVKKLSQHVYKYGRDFPVYFKYRLTGEAVKVQLRIIHMNGMILRNLGLKEGFEGEDLIFTWDGKTQWNTYLTYPPCFLRYDVYSETGFIETFIQILVVY